MSVSSFTTFDSTLNRTNQWLNEIMEALGWKDRHKAYHALRAVLHTLRDRLPPNEAVHLGAQLPMLIRGFYYEGWHPANKPVKERTRDEFLMHITDEFLFDAEANSREITQAVFGVLNKHVTAGEIEDVKSALPSAVRELWV